MTSEQIGGIIRAIVAAVGGYFIGKGVIDADTVTSIGGALATIATAVWSVRSKTTV
jgi:hypothetical protein